MISIIVPFHNEEKNLPLLEKELQAVLKKIDQEYELLFINDGSTDRSAEALITTKCITIPRRRGKGNALATGIKKARGETIIFIDADLQDDPADLPLFLRKIDEGYDLVNGVRIKRHDSWLIKVYSRAANSVLRSLLQSPFTDVNSPFKAIRRSVFTETPLYANNFRFLPLAAHFYGFKVTEVAVNNRPRKYGSSKFGIGKIFIGFFDTLTAYFIYRFAERPLHFFGPIGGAIFSSGFLLSFYLTIEKLVYGVELFRRPALLLGVLLIIVGLQIIMTGIIGELIVYLNKKNSKDL